MDSQRLGWPSKELKEAKAKDSQTTINTGENYSKTRARIFTIEMLTLDREAWKTFVNRRGKKYIQTWEETHAEKRHMPKCQRSELSTLTTFRTMGETFAWKHAEPWEF